MAEKLRNKIVKIRVTEDELLLLHEKKSGRQLARWLRQIALAEKSGAPMKTIDPALLYELNKIGANINQIARHCNAYKENADILRCAISLTKVEKQLHELIAAVVL